jgi:hypothetical protein
MPTKKVMRKAIEETVARWKNTLLGVTPIDVDRAKKLLTTSKNAKIFVVDSPLQFYIAQAVIRGLWSKAEAREYCTSLSLDSAFLDDLRRCGGCRDIKFEETSTGARSWWQTKDPVNYAVTHMLWPVANELNEERSSVYTATNRAEEAADRIMQADLHWLVWLHTRTLPLNNLAEKIGKGMLAQQSDARIAVINEKVVRTQDTRFEPRTSAGRATYTRAVATSRSTDDILQDDFIVNKHHGDAVLTEIIARIMHIKNTEATRASELMHCIPAFMQFNNDGFLILGKQPVMRRNAENLLHNETGPSVEWGDGMREWHIDGHALQQAGQMIVLEPEKLTEEIINNLSNEEERRLAIERLGWDKYLAKTKAVIIDSRENAVDGTVELLIAPPPSEGLIGRQEPMRMVLACRSTGRKYFLAVPNSAVFNRLGEPEIKTCEQAQKWFAGGGTTEHLPYAKHALNIVGAS